MEQTIGKRIVALRKGLGLTQDQLAEQLGVTAQAVSKWENDQSCPDIAMLPKLAEIFGVTTDELLGVERKVVVHEVEVVSKEEPAQENEGENLTSGSWEFKWDSGRRTSVGIAVWVLMTGGILLVSRILPALLDCGFWEASVFTGLLVFGLFGLYPKFSVFRLGCMLVGGYCLVNNLFVMTVSLNRELLLPVFVLLFGLSLLIDAFRKPEKGVFHVTHNGTDARKCSCDMEGERFACATSFGENHHLIRLPRLSTGKAEVSFGELEVDLSGCEEIADGCRIELSCAFGELELLIPKCCRVEPVTGTAFAAVAFKGEPSPDAAATVYVEAKASFGEIKIKYI